MFVQDQLGGIHLQNLHAALEVRDGHYDLPVQAPRPSEGLVEGFREVRRANDNHSIVVLEAVHLHQQLVQSHPDCCVVPVGALGAHSVDLVDEHDAGRMLAGLLKEVPNAPGTHSDKHLLEFRSRCLQEGDASLASNGTGEQRLASSRRAGHHHAFRKLRTKPGEAIRVTKVEDDFLQLLLDLIAALHVLEGRVHLLHRSDLLGAHTESLLYIAGQPLCKDRDASNHYQHRDTGPKQPPDGASVGVCDLHLQRLGLAREL
mmetsp:Transcript_36540/g.85631  ORF Transcript_36540/g.85631 Transcript_36540/m.85631 type:complete len:260 (-) Transcript_36540:566-1345(-)